MDRVKSCLYMKRVGLNKEENVEINRMSRDSSWARGMSQGPHASTKVHNIGADFHHTLQGLGLQKLLQGGTLAARVVHKERRVYGNDCT